MSCVYVEGGVVVCSAVSELFIAVCTFPLTIPFQGVGQAGLLVRERQRQSGGSRDYTGEQNGKAGKELH